MPNSHQPPSEKELRALTGFFPATRRMTRQVDLPMVPGSSETYARISYEMFERDVDAVCQAAIKHLMGGKG